MKAVLDLGTNTFHLLIAKFQNGNLEIKLDLKEGVKIGEKGLVDKMITDQALQRGLKTLKKFHQYIEEHNCESVEVIATSAFRDATNAKEVCDIIQFETGFHVNIISGEEEAQLIYQGVKLSGAIQSEPVLIIDIGGGSVEFIIANNEHLLWKKSFDIGGLRLMELFKYSDPISIIQIKSLNTFLKEELKDLNEAVNQYQPKVLLGSSGAFDTYWDIYKLSKGIESNKPFHELPITFFKKIYQQLTTLDRNQRLEIPGMLPLRVDMIVVASCLVNFILNEFSLKKIRISNYALKEGVFGDL